jgi:hypothetical protein
VATTLTKAHLGRAREYLQSLHYSLHDRQSEGMPRVPVNLGHDSRQTSRREQLLALRALRGDVERGSTQRRAAETRGVAMTEVASRLRELITALDRRAPRAGDTGEPVIARDSAALRDEAVNRLAEIADRPRAATDESFSSPRSKPTV